MAEVKTRYGALTVPDIRSDTIGRFLQHYGEWAWDEVSFVASVLPENASVLDVGAFLGTFGLGVSLQRPLRSLCFVEASQQVTPLLESNVRRNSKVAATVIEALVAGSASTSPPVGHTDPENLGSTSYAPGATGALLVAQPAILVTLSQLREQHGPFDLIKLDAEGMELDILRADAEFLSRGETTIWAECNEAPASIDMAELLLSWGLELHYFAFPSHNPDNTRGATEAILPLAYEAGILAAPRSAPVLDGTLQRHGCILQPIWNSEDLRQALWRTPRWGMSEWQGAPAEQVAALAGRILRNDDRRSFLMPGWQHGRMLWEQVAVLERVLGEERQEAAKVEAELRASAESGRRTLERDLAEAATLALDRLAEIGATREECDLYRKRLRKADETVDRLRAEVKRLADDLEAEVNRLQAFEQEVVRLRAVEQEVVRLRAVEQEAERLAGIDSRFRNLEKLQMNFAVPAWIILTAYGALLAGCVAIVQLVARAVLLRPAGARAGAGATLNPERGP